MLVLFYFQWNGTVNEFQELLSRMKNVSSEIDGLDYKGVYIPASEWHYAVLFETTDYAKVLAVTKTYILKYGQIKISLGKFEVLHTFEELGI